MRAVHVNQTYKHLSLEKHDWLKYNVRQKTLINKCLVMVIIQTHRPFNNIQLLVDFTLR